MLSARNAVFGSLIVACGLLVAGCGGAQSRFASHMQRGQDYFAAGNFSKAGIEFRNAMQIIPKDLSARLMAGRTAENLGKIRDAAGLYQSVLDADTDNVEARSHLARLLILGGAADRALDVVEVGLKKHPDSPDLLTYRAAAHVQLNKPAEALADIDRALKLAPTNEEAVSLRAGMYRDAGDYKDAEALVSGALQHLPNSASLLQVLADLYIKSDESAKAEAPLRALIRVRPGDAQYRYQLAVYYSRAHRLDDAQRLLEETVRAFPESDQPKLALVEFLSSQRGRAQGEHALRGFIAAQPDDNDLRLGLGDLLRSGGDNKQAIATYQEVIRRDETHPKGLIARDRLAAIAQAQGHYDESLKYVQDVLKINPRDDDALLLRAEISLLHNDPAATITDLRGVLRDQPQAVGVHRMLAKAYIVNGEPALAEQSLRSAIELAPKDPAPRIELAEMLVRQKQPDQAVKLLEQAVQDSPKDPAPRMAMVRAYLAKGDFVAARAAADDLKTLRLDAASLYVSGLVAESQNRFDDARTEFEHALQLQPGNFDVLSALARMELTRGQSAQAIALVKAAATRDPKNPENFNLLGELYLAGHDTTQATQTLQHAVDLAPTWWVAYRNLALAKYAQKDTDGAINAYLAGVKACPDEPQLVTELAVLYVGRGRVDDAIAAYESWHRRNPGVETIANNLAMLLVTYKKDPASLDRARDLAAGFASSNDGRLLDTNGWVHFKRAEYTDAVPVLQRAVDHAPDSKEIHYHLGMAELRAGQTDRARKDLETAVSGAGNFSGSDEARSTLAALKSRAG